jgi:peptide chain release factor 2
LKIYGGIFDPVSIDKRINEIDQILADASSWENREKAQEILKERKILTERKETFQKPQKELESLREFIQLAEEEAEESLKSDIEQNLTNLEKQVENLELLTMMSGRNDRGDAILVIHPGAGGTESQDWAEILLRMYVRYCEKKGFKADIVDLLAGEVAGIKSATITVSGDYAYGHLKAEIGVHRLVRISPFDSNKRRHTSFASVFVYPDVEENINVEIKDEDLRIDTYRASGAGGQHVNKVSSAVRITHLPTGIVVQCQNERSQHRNKDIAMKLLRARLYDMEMKKRDAEKAKVESEKMDINFGSQIRSYVLHPYRMIKDHRTDLEIGNVDPVLDGDLDQLIKVFLIKNMRW